MIGGVDPANSGSHREMSSSSPMAPRSTKVVSAAAVSHLLDDATEIGVVPDMPPTVSSWITSPSAATIRIMPSDSPAARTRASSDASVASNAPGAKTFSTVVVVVAGSVVEVVTGLDDVTGPVESLRVLDDDPQAPSNTPDTTNATTRRDHTGRHATTPADAPFVRTAVCRMAHAPVTPRSPASIRR